MKRTIIYNIAAFLVCLVMLAGCGVSSEINDNPSEIPSITETETPVKEPAAVVEPENNNSDNTPQAAETTVTAYFDLSSIPAYSGKPYVTVNENNPYFTSSEHSTTSFEKYTSLDKLGRCGVAFANIGKDIMPTEERGSIGSVKPTGWHTIKYENVDGRYLYNRCHLIGYQLSGENANERNLITGTRYMNVQGMLPFENMVADYVEETGNHVLYRVTPIFDGNNLLATGVLMEALSMEDSGSGICFNVFCYNVQPGIKINYATGDSESEDGSAPYGSSAAVTKPQQETTPSSEATSYIANKNTKKFHYPYCGSVPPPLITSLE